MKHCEDREKKSEKKKQRKEEKRERGQKRRTEEEREERCLALHTFAPEEALAPPRSSDRRFVNYVEFVRTDREKRPAENTLYIPSAVLLSSGMLGNVATLYDSEQPCCKKMGDKKNHEMTVQKRL